MPFPAHALVLLLAGQTPAVPAKVPCVLHLKGDLKHRSPVGTSTSYWEESFTYAIPGTLTEETGADGSVVFDFQPAPDPNLKGSAALRHHSSTLVAGKVQDLTFDGKRFQAFGAVRFTAPLRGQALRAQGSFYVGGKARIVEASPEGERRYEEDRFVLSQPLPFLGVEPGANPAVQFTGSSLWALRNAPKGMALSGWIAYNGGPGARKATGRVDLRIETGR